VGGSRLAVADRLLRRSYAVRSPEIGAVRKEILGLGVGGARTDEKQGKSEEEIVFIYVLLRVAWGKSLVPA
jgi:hypothetical protein